MNPAWDAAPGPGRRGSVTITEPLDPKRCARCGEEKPIAEYPNNARTAAGLSSWCKLCHRQRTQRWRAEHREELLARRRAQYRKRHA